MFTGLIESICKVKSVKAGPGQMRLTIDLGDMAETTAIGDSIAINGACLTVTKLQNTLADFDLSDETLQKTTLNGLKSGTEVNIERALSANARFGGHFVQGHIDGVGKIKKIQRKQQFADIDIQAPAELLKQMIVKGSVAINGISLTITDIDKDSFRVALIPETLNNTTLGTTSPGTAVNIETDMIVKTLQAYLDQILPSENKLSIDKLKEMGF